MQTIKTCVWLIVLAALCLLLDQAVRGAPGDSPRMQTITLLWDAPDPEQEVTAHTIYCRTNLPAGMRLTNGAPALLPWIPPQTTNEWVAIGITTNRAFNGRTVAVTNLPGWSGGYRGPHFFTVTASNFWGESFFGNVAWTPALPTGDRNLRIRAN